MVHGPETAQGCARCSTRNLDAVWSEASWQPRQPQLVISSRPREPTALPLSVTKTSSFQQNTGNRCAAGRFRKSRSTVGAEVKCSNDLKLSALPMRPESHRHCADHCRLRDTPTFLYRHLPAQTHSNILPQHPTYTLISISAPTRPVHLTLAASSRRDPVMLDVTGKIIHGCAFAVTSSPVLVSGVRWALMRRGFRSLVGCSG